MNKSSRLYSLADKILIQVGSGLQTIFAKPSTTNRNIKFSKNKESINPKQINLSASLMRVNHSGEVCAQALYQGQAVFAKSEQVKASLIESAEEENDHLNWCKTRLEELDSNTSLLNPIWYIGSFTIGLTAGAIGDKWSLGFIAETEKQVAKHLDSHLSRLPKRDIRSYDIINQMKIDETRHAVNAIDYGGEPLPKFIKSLMTVTSKIMTVTAFYI